MANLKDKPNRFSFFRLYAQKEASKFGNIVQVPTSIFARSLVY